MTALLKQLVDARNAYTLRLIGKTARPKALTARQASARLFGSVYKDNPDWPTEDTVRSVAGRLMKGLGQQEYTWAMQRYGVQTGKIGDLWIGSWQKFVAEVEAMLSLGASFGDPFRWLLSHPENATLREEYDPSIVVTMLQDGADDVTRKDHFEALYARQQRGDADDEL